MDKNKKSNTQHKKKAMRSLLVLLRMKTRNVPNDFELPQNLPVYRQCLPVCRIKEKICYVPCPELPDDPGFPEPSAVCLRSGLCKYHDLLGNDTRGFYYF